MSLDIYLEEHTGVFTLNITHNLTSMAAAAGIYQAMWRPEEIGVETAGELIPLLEKGLENLIEEPEKFRKLNPENGWGSYESLLKAVHKYLAACREYPEAYIRAHR
jgi:hypothetical protein